MKANESIGYGLANLFDATTKRKVEEDRHQRDVRDSNALFNRDQDARAKMLKASQDFQVRREEAQRRQQMKGEALTRWGNILETAGYTKKIQEGDAKGAAQALELARSSFEKAFPELYPYIQQDHASAASILGEPEQPINVPGSAVPGGKANSVGASLFNLGGSLADFARKSYSNAVFGNDSAFGKPKPPGLKAMDVEAMRRPQTASLIQQGGLLNYAKAIPTAMMEEARTKKYGNPYGLDMQYLVNGQGADSGLPVWPPQSPVTLPNVEIEAPKLNKKRSGNTVIRIPKGAQ